MTAHEIAGNGRLLTVITAAIIMAGIAVLGLLSRILPDVRELVDDELGWEHDRW